eukprot:3375181-Alexandrium_andersonii.AAC.1
MANEERGGRELTEHTPTARGVTSARACSCRSATRVCHRHALHAGPRKVRTPKQSPKDKAGAMRTD